MDIKICFTPTGQYLIYENAYRVQIWHLPEGRLLLRDDGKLIGIASSGQSVLLETLGHKVRVFDLLAETHIPLEEAHPKDYPVGARCILRTKQNLIQVVDALSGVELISVPLSDLIGTSRLHPGINATCLSSDGKFFAVSIAGDSMWGEWARGYCVDLNGKVHFEFSVNSNAQRPMLQMTGRYLVVENAAQKRALWDVPTGQVEQTLLTGQNAGAFAAVNESEVPPVIAVHMERQRVTISQAGRWLSTINAQHTLYAGTFYPDNRHLALLGENNTIAFYEWRTGSYKGSFKTG